MEHDATATGASVVRYMFTMLDVHGIRATAEAVYSPDVVFVDLPDFPDGGEHFGRDAVIQHLERFFEAWQGYSIELIDVVEARDRVAAHFWLTGSGVSSGVDMTSELWHVCTVRDGTIVRVEAYSSEPEAIAALNR